MHIELSPEDEQILSRHVQEGHFSSVQEAFREAVYVGLSMFAMKQVSETHDAEYLAYVDDAVREGLADLDAGRVVPAEEVFALLREASQQTSKAA